MNGPSVSDVDKVIARQLDSAANTLSGLGEHGLANQVWAVANRIRNRSKTEQERK